MGLLNDRRREMGAKDDCPYQRVEYLEVNEDSGKAWIDTQYIPFGGDIDIYCRFMILGYNNNNPYSSLFMAHTNDASQAYRLMRHGNNEIIMALNNGSQSNTSSRVNIEHGVIYTLEMIGSTRTYRLNDEKGIVPNIVSSPNTTSMKLFADKSDKNYPDRMIYSRIYSFRMNKGGEAVLNLIPVRIGDEGFMYDRVSGKLFGNSGDGRFIIGPDIN